MARTDSRGIGERVASVETTLEEIKTNHLPHLQIGLDDINSKIFWGLVAIISTGMGVLINIGLIYAQAHISPPPQTSITTTTTTK